MGKQFERDLVAAGALGHCPLFKISFETSPLTQCGKKDGKRRRPRAKELINGRSTTMRRRKTPATKTRLLERDQEGAQGGAKRHEKRLALVAGRPLLICTTEFSRCGDMISS